MADYPLQITPAGDPKIMNTVEFLMNQCFYEGAFFQDMIHSGINAYLTLDIAQTLLRAGDLRYQELIRNVADLASPTGQWPEAIHPHTKGGCMGDGQHGWAAATPHGPVTVRIVPQDRAARVEIEGYWHDRSPEIRIAIPGFAAAAVAAGENITHLRKEVSKK